MLKKTIISSPIASRFSPFCFFADLTCAQGHAQVADCYLSLDWLSISRTFSKKPRHWSTVFSHGKCCNVIGYNFYNFYYNELRDPVVHISWALDLFCKTNGFKIVVIF